jgi:hypothetical protein
MSEILFEPISHKYFLGDSELPSVTQILGDLNFIDSSYFTEESRRRGEYVHSATEFDDRGSLDDASVDSTILSYLSAWRRFKRENSVKIYEIEKIVGSPIYRYAGTLDRIVELNGFKAILDIKSGAVGKATGLQTAGYEIGYNSDQSLKRFAVQLKNDGSYKLHPFTDRDDRKIFLSAVSVWHWINKNSRILL